MAIWGVPDASSVKRVKQIPPVYLQVIFDRAAYCHSPLCCSYQPLCSLLLTCAHPNAPAALSEKSQMPPPCKVLHLKINCLRARQVQHLVPRHSCNMAHVLGTLVIQCTLPGWCRGRAHGCAVIQLTGKMLWAWKQPHLAKS